MVTRMITSKSFLAEIIQFIKFSMSSFVSFLVTYATFCLMMFTPVGSVCANIISRLAGRVVNYTLNSKVVFQTEKKTEQTLPQYALLAVIVLVINTLILQGLIRLGLEARIAKVLAEMATFPINWAVQNLFIFKCKANNVNKTEVYYG